MTGVWTHFKAGVQHFNHYVTGTERFDCMWTKVYLNTINSEYGLKKKVLLHLHIIWGCQFQPILTNSVFTC